MIELFYSLSVLLMILIPIFIAVLLRRRFEVPWFLFCVGCLTFLASQAVHLPLNQWLANLGILPSSGLQNPESIPLWRTALLAGLTAGLCEELARAAGFAILRRFRQLEHGIMLGLGHGGIEAMLFGGVMTAAGVSSLLSLRGVDLSTLNLASDQLAALGQQLQTLGGSPWVAFLPLIERLMALIAHVSFSALVLLSFRKHNVLYLILAILFHTLVDAASVYLINLGWGVGQIYLVLFAIVAPLAIWLLGWGRRRASEVVHPVTPLRQELTVFFASFSKEVLYQWRSKRILIIVAVFALFGMTSPLLAYFTPQIIGSIAGAQQFAPLIPTPTVADAYAQYVKNMSQFGFILAILLGMGAVAGEKETGTAAMILSKPMSRWSFLAGKFIAQGIVYLAGFLLSMLGAYYYMVVLFGPTSLAQFALVNLLLFAWLLPFVALTLLGSVIAKTTSAAAGIGFAGAVVLLLSAYIPKVGGLAPGALIAWAGQIGAAMGTAVAGNWGAVAVCLVVVLIGVLTSVAVFEVQEL